MGESLIVLVVEDDRDIRELVKLMLEIAGYRVFEAENGFQGLEMARQHKPDAILMDMSLPVMDGCRCTRHIRQEPRFKNIPIIACTAYNRWEWRGKAILAGCTDFLTKPYDSRKLLAMLSHYLGQLPQV